MVKAETRTLPAEDIRIKPDTLTVPVKRIAALHARKARVLHAHYTQCPRTLHVESMNTTRRLHAFYARAGAAIPLTSTVLCWLSFSFPLAYFLFF